jgi:hypothetical protein
LGYVGFFSATVSSVRRLQKKGKSAVVDLYIEALYLFCLQK